MANPKSSDLAGPIPEYFFEADHTTDLGFWSFDRLLTGPIPEGFLLNPNARVSMAAVFKGCRSNEVPIPTPETKEP